MKKFKFIYINHLEEHIGEKTSDSMECEMEIQSKDLEEEKSVLKFKCSKCKYVSTNLASHLIHINSHDGEVSLNCTECKYQCKNENVLLNHFASHDIYLCIYCDFISDSPISIADHNKIHLKQKPLSCSECEFSCKHYKQLSAHMKIHQLENEIASKHSEIMSSPILTNGKNGKRDLSLSPEDTDNSKKNLRSGKEKKAKS